MIMMSQSARVALNLLCSPNRQMAGNPLDSIVMRHLISTAEPVSCGLMTGCRWPDNQKSRIIDDDPKTTY
jgi:hypothetical protein